MAGAVAFFLAFAAGSAAKAEEANWRVAKVSGEAWIAGSSVQAASASANPVLHPGETVRTGRNGRVLLTRGAESILVSANSSISLPEAGRPGQTTVIQQAGSILLDVEKRNVPHFEVETPYLAAVVKGTQFRVSVQGGRAKVDVVRGRVQVSDFRSGQFAMVSPGQSARASFGRDLGLHLSGSGSLAPIQSGPAQTPRVMPLQVPGRGLGTLPGAIKLPRSGDTPRSAVAPTTRRGNGQHAAAPGATGGPKGAARISAPIGDVRLDIGKATRGMARSDAQDAGRSGRHPTVWSTGELNPGSQSSRDAVTNSGAASGATQAASGANAAASANANGGGSGSSSISTSPGNAGGGIANRGYGWAEWYRNIRNGNGRGAGGNGYGYGWGRNNGYGYGRGGNNGYGYGRGG
jgi:hypothetical protein